MEIKKITSASNLHIKKLLAGKNKPRINAAEGFLIEGLNLLESAISERVTLHEVLFSENFIARHGNGFLRDLPRGVGLFEISEHIMRKITDTENPQGIIAVVSYPEHSLEGLQIGESALLAVLDGVQDPGNVGSVIRTADAAAADAVILLPGSCNPFMPKVTRSTAGSIFHIPIIRAEIGAFLNWRDEKGISLAVTAGKKGNEVFDTELGGAVALVFGNEARGVRDELREKADFFLNIPIYGKAESLNVAAAAAICLFEAARQKKSAGAPK